MKRSNPSNGRMLIVVLEDAPLEIVRVGGSNGGSKGSKDGKYHLLNSDDHQSILRRSSRNIADYRPDIVHQCLLTLLDSPLNKAGMLQVYIHTQKNVLIEVNPRVRIPRTFLRFAGLMVQLLHKLSIKATAGDEVLLNVIRNPITDHLPVNAIRIGLGQAGTVASSALGGSTFGMAKQVYLDARKERSSKSSGNNSANSGGDLDVEELPVVCFLGAKSHGEDAFEHAERLYSFGPYALSASVACGKLCDSFEHLWMDA